MTDLTVHPLFSVWGIEIEYMIVDRQTLDVRPLVAEVLREASGSDEWIEDFDGGPIGWSNELVSHVLEFKNVEPVPSIDGLASLFSASLAELNGLLEKHGCRVMPSGMHPWMVPPRDTVIWPHESGPIYQAYDRLFDCRRHGWSNLQSVHLNLPFSGEDEFARLMAATRLVLPLIPALAASSPIVEGRATGRLDNRLAYYRSNAERVPAMAGRVIPEPVYGFDEYQEKVLAPIHSQLRDIDADPLMQGQEWVNARGAIARFDRMAIEIRLIDSQECPRSDLAVAAAVCGAVRGLVEERWSSFEQQREWPTESLVALLDRAIDSGPAAVIDDRDYAGMFGDANKTATTAGNIWTALADTAFDGPAELEKPLAVVLDQGTLAQRVLEALGPDFAHEDLRSVYDELCDCLDNGDPFRP